MGGGSRPLARCCKMRCRISGMKGGTKLCNDDDGGQLNHGNGGLRINVHGDLYVPDTEEEESDMEVEADARPCKIQRADARPCKIRRGGPRMDVHGVLYVPDSEEEDSDTEVEANSEEDEVDAEAGSATSVLAMDKTVDGVEPAVKKAAEIAAAMQLTPEVQARLEAVLANMDPLFHDEFVGVYKIMVPIFFKP